MRLIQYGFIFLLVLPFLFSLLVLARQRSHKYGPEFFFWGFFLSMTIGFIVYADDALQINWTHFWFRNETMGVSYSTSPAFIIIMVGIVRLLSLISQPNSRPLLSGLVLLGFGFAQVALYSAEVFLRFITLELASVCVSLIPLALSDETMETKIKMAEHQYFPLRVIGSILFVVFLSLSSAVGSMQIAELANPPNQVFNKLQILLLFLIFMSWIKTAAPPFSEWVKQVREETYSAWLFSNVILTSTLAYYLLYKFYGLLDRANLVPFIFLSAILISISSAYINRISKSKFEKILAFDTASFSHMLFLILMGRASQNLLTAILALILIRSAFYFVVRSEANRDNPVIHNRFQWLLIIYSLARNGYVIFIAFQHPRPWIGIGAGLIILIAADIFSILQIFRSDTRISFHSIPERTALPSAIWSDSGQIISLIETHLSNLLDHANSLISSVSNQLLEFHDQNLRKELTLIALLLLIIFSFFFVLRGIG